MIETIHIYHTNDLHSHFEQWPKIVQYIDGQKKIHSIDKENMLLYDIGDHVDRVHPISEASMGQYNVQLLNEMEYNGVTIGNNEGITLPFEALDQLYKEAKFDVLVANLYKKDGHYPEWVKPYKIHKLSNGVKVAVFGCTVFYKSFYRLLGWDIRDPYETIENILNIVRHEADIIVLLSHLGINEDEDIAKRYPEIDVILGGHTHHLFENGKVINQSLVCGAGKYGQYIGHVELQIDVDLKKILSKKATVINTKELQDECEETKAQLQVYTEESEKILNVEVAFLKQEMPIKWFEESPLAKLLAEAIREWCDGEVSMVNAGMILASLPKGSVTRKDLHQICPHPINPCKVELKGDELKEIILQATTKKVENLAIKGLGFRGKVMGKMIYDGVKVKSVTLEDGECHVRQILVNNEPLDPERLYSVATVDMYTLGHLFPAIRDAKHKKYYMPEMLRDLLKNKLEVLKT